MNRKVIKSILNKKLNDWVKSIKDEEVQKLVKKNTIVTGGAIANLLLNEEIKDYDLYFRDKATTYAVAKYYVDQFNSAHPNTQARVIDGETLSTDKKFIEDFKLTDSHVKGVTPDRVKIYIKSAGVAAENDEILTSPFEDAVEAMSDADQLDENLLESQTKDPYRPVFLSSNAVTLSNKIQLVVRFYGSPEKVHESFDFAHCTNYYDFGENELVLKQEALECLMNKELKYIGSRYPICSVIRTRKFIKRGFHSHAGNYLKMCLQISKLDLTDINVLEDQLIGVDSGFFQQLINALKYKQETDSDFKVENSYISSIIDRIF